jgi:hypothetical protein
VLLVATVAVAEPPNKAAVEKAIVANETAINLAVAKGDLAGFSKYMAKDAWSVDQTGMMAIADFEKAFGQVKVEPGWKIDASKVIWIDDNVAVHMYHWTGQGSFAGQAFGDSFSSTVWANRGGSWLVVFHHEAPAAPPMAGPGK